MNGGPEGSRVTGQAPGLSRRGFKTQKDPWARQADSWQDVGSLWSLLSHLQPLARQEEQVRMVRQFHFHGWPEVGIPAEGKGMIDLIAAVQKQQQQTGNHPITVHCR